MAGRGVSPVGDEARRAKHKRVRAGTAPPSHKLPLGTRAMGIVRDDLQPESPWDGSALHPLIGQMCHWLATDEPEVCLTLPVAAMMTPPANPLAGSSVLDVGGGDPRLGAYLAAGGAQYTTVSHEDVDELEARVANVEARTLVTVVLPRERTADPRRLLDRLGRALSQLDRDVPVLLVTHDRRWQDDTSPRSNRWYEQVLRDAGLFVRSCEPVRTDDAAAGSISADPWSLWAWRLVARRRRCVGDDGTEEVRAAVLDEFPPIDQPFLREMVIYRVDPGRRLLCAGNLGGGLVLVIEGTAEVFYRGPYAESPASHDDERGATKQKRTRPSVRDADAAVPASRNNYSSHVYKSGTVLGEVEAEGPDGPTHYSHDVLAGKRGCTIGVIAAASVRKLLQRPPGLHQRVFEKVRRRLQLLVFSDGVRHVGESWSNDDHLPKLPDTVILPKLPDAVAQVDPVYIWRAARALVWGAAIERRSRARDSFEDVAFLDLQQVALLVQPNRKKDENSGLKKGLRQLHSLDIIDAFVMRYLTEDRDPTVHECARDMLKDLLGQAFDALLMPHARRDMEQALIAQRKTMIASDEAFQKEFVPTKSFRRMLEGVRPCLVSAGVDDAVARFQFYVVRLSAAFRDKGSLLFCILRDAPALRTIALGDINAIEQLIRSRAMQHTLAPRASTTQPRAGSSASAAGQVWESMRDQSSRDRRLHYLREFRSFFQRCITDPENLRFSDEVTSTSYPRS